MIYHVEYSIRGYTESGYPESQIEGIKTISSCRFQGGQTYTGVRSHAAASRVLNTKNASSNMIIIKFILNLQSLEENMLRANV